MATKIKTNEEKLEALFKTCMGENVHTAFRKGSDHPSATEIWNAIHKMPKTEWKKVMEWMCWALAYSLESEITVNK